jgi:hypothetical protein
MEDLVLQLEPETRLREVRDEWQRGEKGHERSKWWKPGESPRPFSS